MHALEDEVAELTRCTFSNMDKSWKIMLSGKSKKEKSHILKYHYINLNGIYFNDIL